MPLHSWLPRAHPVAPAHLSALMSGMMIKLALYGLIRVEFEWLGSSPRWLGLTLLAVGLLSAVGGVLAALMQHDLKRLLAYHSIENVGIIVLGPRGVDAVRRRRGARVGRDRVRRRAAAHRQPRDLQGAAVPGCRSVRTRRRRPADRPAGRAAAPHASDRGGVPDRLDGDRRPAAAQRLRLGVADAAVAAARRAGPAARRRAGGRRGPRRPRGHRRPRAAVLRQGRRPRAAGPAAPRRVRHRCRGPRRHARRDAVPGRALHRARSAAGPRRADTGRPGARRRRSRARHARRPGRPRHRLAAHARARPRAARPGRPARAPARRPPCGPCPHLGLRPARRARVELDLGRLHQAAAPRPGGGAAPRARHRGRARRRHRAAHHLLRPGPVARRHAALRPGHPRRAARGGRRAPPPDRQRPHLCALPAGARDRPARARAPGALG